ncbi:hypothetical protein AYO38_03195 [bacterium SCGC AG-212-C10]|nr:hypothetical protein AYO38_03195 [bacterium SCGC AG-212-C10]
MIRGAFLATGILGGALAAVSGIAAVHHWSDRAADALAAEATPVPSSTATVFVETPPPAPTSIGTPVAETIATLPEHLPASPIEPQPGAGMLELQATLREMRDSYPEDGHFSIAVTDLQTGEMISVSGDRLQLSGCVMNYFVLLQTVRDIQEGRLDFDDDIDWMIRYTIEHSDAATAQELFAIAGDGDPVRGVARVSALIHEDLGLDDVVIDHPPAFGDDTVGVDNDNWVTAREMNRAMAQLYHGQSLDEEWTAYLLDAMTGVYYGLNYLIAYGNDGVTSHKNGFFPYEHGYVDNDTGIVRFERNGREYAYAVTFLSEGVGELYADIWLGRAMMEEIWAYFDATYPDEAPASADTESGDEEDAPPPPEATPAENADDDPAAESADSPEPEPESSPDEDAPVTDEDGDDSEEGSL